MMISSTDAELLKRYLQEGAEDAFGTLVERHLALVYGVALRRLRDPALAQEVTQTVFITLARRADWLTSHLSFGGWLYRTTVHLTQHELRTEQRRRRREEIALELGTCMKMDESLLLNIAPLLDEAMLELRVSDRETLLLRYFGNKSLREVGTALAIGEDAAQKRVAKALDALPERFRQRGFRVVGAAALALTLQQASAHAVPAGLALSTTKVALAAGAATSFGSLTAPILKIMSITKIQTAALCLTIAALPLGYQWHALAQARSLNERTTTQLQQLRTDAFARERDQARAQRRVAAAQKELSQPLASPDAQPSRKQPDLYAWDENSPYVRVPKQVLSKVRFAPFASRVARDGKVEAYQLPPLLADGSPLPVLEAALGLSADEAEKLRALCQSAFADFYRLAASHSQLTEVPWAGGQMASVKYDTAAFPAERESTDNAFGDLLGQFRRVETQRMEPVTPPANWSVGASGSTGPPGLPFDSALTYHIPDLSKDISAAQTTFLGQLQQDLGASRANIVASAADSYLRQNMDNLGAGDRIVGFVWMPESEGTHSLWYAAADARKGEGAFQRVGEDLDLNSQTAYYAQLFGIKLPGQ